MIFLETERLVLRQVLPQDSAIMHDYRNHPDCARYQRGQTKDPDGIRLLVEQRQQDVLNDRENCLIAIALRETGELVGEIVVMPNDGCFTLGYTLSYRHHRRGYAFEALSALTDMLHEAYPRQEFICFVDPENTASRKLLEKLGYRDYGYVEKITSHVFGKWIAGNPLE